MRNLKDELEMIRYIRKMCFGPPRVIDSCNCCFSLIYNNVIIFDDFFRSENMTLQSKLNYWEIRAKYSSDRLYSFKKENEHQVIINCKSFQIKVSLWMILIFFCVLHFQLIILKHENELISNAEKQARQMVTNLSQRLHCLQVSIVYASFIACHSKWEY